MSVCYWQVGERINRLNIRPNIRLLYDTLLLPGRCYEIILFVGVEVVVKIVS